MTRKIAALLTLLILMPYKFVMPETKNVFDLSLLEGKWEGEGEVLVPKTSIPIGIEGEAVFSYDEKTRKLRTSLEAGRFFFNYADSGYLYHDTATDSITWEVWDGFGKHCLYSGRMENNRITGSQKLDGKDYRVVIDLITDDSLTFSLTTKYANGQSRKRAVIDMWRSD